MDAISHSNTIRCNVALSPHHFQLRHPGPGIVLLFQGAAALGLPHGACAGGRVANGGRKMGVGQGRGVR